jgi:anti-sigma B factor antagonist
VTIAPEVPAPDDRTVVVDVEPVMPGALGASPVLANRLRVLVAQGYQLILLNVADLTYCDSVTLGAIVQAYASAVRAGATLKLIHVTERFRQLLVSTKLDRIIESAESPDAKPDSDPRA